MLDFPAIRGARVCVVAWDCQEGVQLAGAGSAKARDLPLIVDCVCIQQIQRSVGRNERVEILHHAVLPKEGTGIQDTCSRTTNDLAAIVDSLSTAGRIALDRAQVLRSSLSVQRKA